MISISLIQRKFFVRASYRSRVFLYLSVVLVLLYSSNQALFCTGVVYSLDFSRNIHNLPLAKFLSPNTKTLANDKSPPRLENATEVQEKHSDKSEYGLVRQNAEKLPLYVFVPLEEAVADFKLEGWEDEWISDGVFNATRWGKIKEPKIDVVYNWVNGSEQAFKDTIQQYEATSKLNDPQGEWLATHRKNRFAPWNELLYSIRSVEKYSSDFLNRIQILVNNVKLFHFDSFDSRQQHPDWLASKESLDGRLEVLSQEEFFVDEVKRCLPAFNSRTIESMIFNTKSDTDRVFAMSDDMFLNSLHTASDIYSPLFGTSIGFKNNTYNKQTTPNETDLARFGEKPGLIYTSWLLNQRFGARKRSGQLHVGHSISRAITREALNSFPGPFLKSACTRFRNEDFQINTWYLTFHYTMERFREALLLGYLLRSDLDSDGTLDWDERSAIVSEVAEAQRNHLNIHPVRDRIYEEVPDLLKSAGLAPPAANAGAVNWTSLDGPYTTMKTKCHKFDIRKCLGKGFISQKSKKIYSTISIHQKLSKENPKCGDCLIKILLNRKKRGLSNFLPRSVTQEEKRAMVIKALMKYQYMVVAPQVEFVMVSNATQLEMELASLLPRKDQESGHIYPTQICLNDDIKTEQREERDRISQVMQRGLEKLWPEKSTFEQG